MKKNGKLIAKILLLCLPFISSVLILTYVERKRKTIATRVGLPLIISLIHAYVLCGAIGALLATIDQMRGYRFAPPIVAAFFWIGFIGCEFTLVVLVVFIVFRFGFRKYLTWVSRTATR